MTAHWGVLDPAAVTGSDVDKINAFRQAFRQLENRIKVFASLPLDKLDTLYIQQELDKVGRLTAAEMVL